MFKIRNHTINVTFPLKSQTAPFHKWKLPYPFERPVCIFWNDTVSYNDKGRKQTIHQRIKWKEGASQMSNAHVCRTPLFAFCLHYTSPITLKAVASEVGSENRVASRHIAVQWLGWIFLTKSEKPVWAKAIWSAWWQAHTDITDFNLQLSEWRSLWSSAAITWRHSKQCSSGSQQRAINHTNLFFWGKKASHSSCY